MHAESKETDQRPIDNFTVLQNARLDAALSLSETRLKNAASYDMISNPNNSFVKLYSNTIDDHGRLSVSDLMALNALGVDSSKILSETGRNSGPEDELIANVQLPNSELTIRRFSEGFTKYLNQAGGQGEKAIDGEYISQKLSERYASSPAHQALASLKDKLDNSSGIKGGISTEPFDSYKDTLATLDFLTTIGITNNNKVIQMLRSGADPKEIINQSIAEVPDYLGTVSEDEKNRVVLWKKQGLEFKLSQEKLTGLLTYQINKDPASLYWEVANQNPGVTEVPFIETECGKELCKALDSKGLKFSKAFSDEIVRLGEAERFGGVYTQLTRELSKWINDPQRLALSKLFVPFDNESTEYLDSFEAEELETNTRQLWLSRESTVNGEAAEVITSLVDQTLLRDMQKEQPTDLPSTEKRVKISDGACFDVFSYYLGAGASIKALTQTTSGNNVRLLEKTYGSHTFMNIDPITFNGVILPKGSLFAKAEDEGWALLRLTPFSFEKPIDQQAFGSEITKAYENERREIAYLGGTSIRHLVKATR